MKFEASIKNWRITHHQCVILKTITIKRVLLYKIFEEFAREIVDSSRMQWEQSKMYFRIVANSAELGESL